MRITSSTLFGLGACLQVSGGLVAADKVAANGESPNVSTGTGTLDKATANIDIIHTNSIGDYPLYTLPPGFINLADEERSRISPRRSPGILDSKSSLAKRDSWYEDKRYGCSKSGWCWKKCGGPPLTDGKWGWTGGGANGQAGREVFKKCTTDADCRWDGCKVNLKTKKYCCGYWPGESILGDP